jgi:hypothetical protein
VRPDAKTLGWYQHALVEESCYSPDERLSPPQALPY